MRAIFIAAVMAVLISSAALAHSGLIVKPSVHGVTETLDRLEAVLKKKGVTVFARVDHAAGAKKAGLPLAPTRVLIFGNPKLGTPLMQSNRAIGIDLPLKVLAWKDENGKVWLAYNDPAYLAKRHAIVDRDPVFAKMAKILDKLTDAATRR